MNPRIEKLAAKKLIGLHLNMSMADNKTGQLWGQFAPRIKEIQHKVSEDKISLQIYPPLFYERFNPSTVFEKWAAVEVSSFELIPTGMQHFTLESGLYAVFDYKGLSTDPSIYQTIFYEWLPQSNFEIDNRPHFELLGPNYKNNDPTSEEEIWIPIIKSSSTVNK